MKRLRNLPNVEGIRRGGPSIKGASPKKFFYFKMSVEANLMNFEAISSCENKLILQALAVFQMLTTANLNPYHQIFRPLGGFHLIRRCYQLRQQLVFIKHISVVVFSLLWVGFFCCFFTVLYIRVFVLEQLSQASDKRA